jgi:hypothetical protein
MGGWVVIGLLSISHDLLAPLLIHIRRKLHFCSCRLHSLQAAKRSRDIKVLLVTLQWQLPA